MAAVTSHWETWAVVTGTLWLPRPEHVLSGPLGKIQPFKKVHQTLGLGCTPGLIPWCVTLDPSLIRDFLQVEVLSPKDVR